MRSPPARVLLPAALTLSFPLLSHAATLLAEPALQWLALMAVVAIPVSGALLRGRPAAWTGMLLAALLLWWLVHRGGGQYALFLPSVLLPLAIAAGFGQSLRPGRTPVVLLIAETLGKLPGTLRDYCRRLTWFWTLFTASLAAVALALCVSGELHAWSLFANFGSYALIALAVIVEYALRRRWFPDYAHPSFVAYLRLIASGRPGRGA